MSFVNIIENVNELLVFGYLSNPINLQPIFYKYIYLRVIINYCNVMVTVDYEKIF